MKQKNRLSVTKNVLVNKNKLTDHSLFMVPVLYFIVISSYAQISLANSQACIALFDRQESFQSGQPTVDQSQSDLVNQISSDIQLIEFLISHSDITGTRKLKEAYADFLVHEWGIYKNSGKWENFADAINDYIYKIKPELDQVLSRQGFKTEAQVKELKGLYEILNNFLENPEMSQNKKNQAKSYFDMIIQINSGKGEVESNQELVKSFNELFELYLMANFAKVDTSNFENRMNILSKLIKAQPSLAADKAYLKDYYTRNLSRHKDDLFEKIKSRIDENRATPESKAAKTNPSGLSRLVSYLVTKIKAVKENLKSRLQTKITKPQVYDLSDSSNAQIESLKSQALKSASYYGKATKDIFLEALKMHNVNLVELFSVDKNIDYFLSPVLVLDNGQKAVLSVVRNKDKSAIRVFIQSKVNGPFQLLPATLAKEGFLYNELHPKLRLDERLQEHLQEKLESAAEHISVNAALIKAAVNQVDTPRQLSSVIKKLK